MMKLLRSLSMRKICVCLLFVLVLKRRILVKPLPLFLGMVEPNTNWWFDPVNWSHNTSIGAPWLPPGQPTSATDSTPVATDAQINIGTGAWDTTGEGVVYDPANDPFFAGASSLTYPTGSAATPFVGSDYGPEHIYRIYIGRNVTTGLTNKLTIKSGDLVIASTFVVGRSGSTVGNENLGTIVQTGGRLRTPVSPMDLGQAETSGWGNGTYDYRGGTLEVDIEGTNGIRVAHGGGNTMAGGKGKFIVHNPTSGGHVRAWRYQSASHRGGVRRGCHSPTIPTASTPVSPRLNSTTRTAGLGRSKSGRSLSINNGLQTDTLGTVSSRLDLVLHEAACAGAACVPNNIGLFDVDFDLGFGSNGGIVAGSGEKGGYFSNVTAVPSTTPRVDCLGPVRRRTLRLDDQLLGQHHLGRRRQQRCRHDHWCWYRR